ncbi:MAG: PAS domain-containing protein [Candidatus Acidiferrum sp.]
MLHHAHPELKGAEFVVFADASRRYVDCTEAVCILLGYTRDEMLSKTIEDVSYDVNEVPRLFALYLKTGAMEGEYVLRRKDTMPVPIRYKAFVLKDGCNAAIWDPIKDWREPYLAALLEMDSAKLKRKLEVALAAIQAARASQGPSVPPPPEQQAMNDAVSALNSLLRTVKPGPTMSR